MSDDKIIPINRPQLVRPNGALTAMENNKQEAPVAEMPEGRDFDFFLHDGTVYKGKGHLIATAAFVGLASSKGDIIFLTPMTNLAYTEEVEVSE